MISITNYYENIKRVIIGCWYSPSVFAAITLVISLFIISFWFFAFATAGLGLYATLTVGSAVSVVEGGIIGLILTDCYD